MHVFFADSTLSFQPVADGEKILCRRPAHPMHGPAAVTAKDNSLQ